MGVLLRKRNRSRQFGRGCCAAWVCLTLLGPETSAEAIGQLQGVRLGGLLAAGGIIPINGNAVQACSRVVGYLQGGFGTLVASVAGMGAIVSAALGGFKTAWTLVVIGVGTFILRTFLTLFMTGC